MKYRSFEFDAQGGELFVLFIKNLILTMLTFGVYYFWANVEQKKFVYQHTSFQGHRFEYTATGKEKFIAFLKVIGIFVVAGVAFSMLMQLVMPTLFDIFGPASMIILMLIIYGGLFMIFPIIQFRAYHFMLRRSRLNNIAFSMDGEEMAFAKLSWKMTAISILSFGLAVPWMLVEQQRYLTKHTKYAQVGFEFRGDGQTLFLRLIGGYILSVITLGIYLPWFIEGLRSFYIGNTVIDEVQMEYKASGGAYFVELLVNIVLLAVTFGLATPWVIVRNIKFISDRVSYDHKINFAGLFSVASKDASAFGEEAMALFE